MAPAAQYAHSAPPTPQWESHPRKHRKSRRCYRHNRYRRRGCFPHAIRPGLAWCRGYCDGDIASVEWGRNCPRYNIRLIDAGVAVALPVALVALLAWRRNVIGLVMIVCAISGVAGDQRDRILNGIWLSAAFRWPPPFRRLFCSGPSSFGSGRNQAQYFATQSQLAATSSGARPWRWLAESWDFSWNLSGRDAAIIFIDLSGFTGLSETLGPNATPRTFEHASMRWWTKR